VLDQRPSHGRPRLHASPNAHLQGGTLKNGHNSGAPYSPSVDQALARVVEEVLAANDLQAVRCYELASRLHLPSQAGGCRAYIPCRQPTAKRSAIGQFSPVVGDLGISGRSGEGDEG